MAHQHDRLESIIFTPTDWHLLRKCPCPVWMVKDQPWPEEGTALVAVNLSSEDPLHDPLNLRLVKETLELAEHVNQTPVHLISAYPVTPIISPLNYLILTRVSITMLFAVSIWWR